jgi:hypothetical protein
MTKVTVSIPVGPFPANKRWVLDAVDSVRRQTVPAGEILLIDDMAGFDLGSFDHFPREDDSGVVVIDDKRHILTGCHVYAAPWRLGVAHAFNFGVALAANDLVFMLGSDDTLEPECIERCLAEWERQGQRDGYYYVALRYMDTGEVQTVPCNAAMVTKGLWKATGGFAPESAIGAPDAAFISTLMVHSPSSLIPVTSAGALYWYRRHPDTDTAGRGLWQAPILEVRSRLTADWKPPAWGRY